MIPWFLFAFYQLFIASERYESISRIIVKQPSTIAAPLPEMALLGSLGMSSGGNDSSLVHAYIYSTDLLKYLNAELDVYGHYTSRNIDIFSRLASDAEQEDFYAFYKEHVTVLLDPASQIIDISVQGFEPVFAQKLNLLIVERTEWYINTISQRLAQNQLEFINSEHERVETKFAKARTELLEFQEKHELLNPEAEGAAMQNITYGLESQIVNKQAELIALSQYMSNESSEVKTAKNQLTALTKQLESERQRLSAVTGKNISVSQLLGKFQELKVNVELAMQSFASSLVSMEKSRVEAYQQVKYLVTVQNPPLPQSAAYPTVWYNIILFGVIAFLLFGIVRIVVATILELS
ncbi:lipopolysaccharide biosynthesis protein [Psychrosphaera haliotis]|uniref:Lipopolysaccharide biosynthesis protein n=1 Tax=Psychrosphaera haliotis TaxID=555083 RepID=A0A6N8F3Y8_9GAMM|nr:lipopolysaccharide biosynthesis protein [Psychrosphaera haliotis]